MNSTPYRPEYKKQEEARKQIDDAELEMMDSFNNEH